MLLLLSQQIAPLPVNHTIGNETYAIQNLSYSCKTTVNEDCLEQMQPAIDFYSKLIFPSGVPKSTASGLKTLNKVEISLETSALPQDFASSNQTYSVNVNNSIVTILAQDQFGACRALSTLSQIVLSNYTNQYNIKQQYVYDFPVYKYRAVMVDSARHFLPISTLKRQVAALSVSKMSVLHLHEPDSQSFPTLPITEPATNFVKGAWSILGHKYYHTMDDLKELATYAKNLGIFIMIEFDMPGHASSWSSATREIVCSCTDVIHPFNELTYKYIEAFLKDIFDAMYKPFGFNPIVHLGGDEVNSGCFAGDASVKKIMDEKGWNAKQTWQYLHQRVVDIIEKLANDMYPTRSKRNFRFYWQESFSNGNNLTNGGVCHAWMSSWEIANSVDKGYYAVRSQGWYLDINQPGGSQEAFVDSWMDFYKVNPAERVPADKKHMVLGGGACQWGEKVNDGNVDEQVWPRSIATAEVLWSEPKDRTITIQLKIRLNELTCKIRQAGTQTGAIIPSAPCAGIDDRGDNLTINNWRQNAAEDDDSEGWGGKK